MREHLGENHVVATAAILGQASKGDLCDVSAFEQGCARNS